MAKLATDAGSPIIVALDVPHIDAALALADQLDPRHCRLKIGKELFTREGPHVVKAMQSKGFDVFLDLKFHDIPTTVAHACRVAVDMGVWMLNVHASGGARMLEAAREAVDRAGCDSLLIAVTVLTSMERGDLAQIGLDCEPVEQVMRLAKLTRDCGLHGVVCSAQEAGILRESIAPPFTLVTPGIRLETSPADDQRRVMTPSHARQAGVDFLVIGRPITQANEPGKALADLWRSLQV